MQYIGYIYLTTNLVNGKQYVGQHQSKEYDPYYKGSGTALKLAFDKYGLENFKCEILCWCKTIKELNYREQCEIVFHSTFAPNGYNINYGGRGRVLRKNTKEKISKTLKGRPNLALSKKVYQFTLDGEFVAEYKSRADAQRKTGVTSLPNALIGRAKSAGGYLWSYTNQPPKYEKFVPWNKGITNCYCKETIEKIRLSKLGKQHPNRCKKVYQYTKNGVFIAEYQSAQEIKRKFGYSNKCISACCCNRKKSAYGYVWSFTPL